MTHPAPSRRPRHSHRILAGLLAGVLLAAPAAAAPVLTLVESALELALVSWRLDRHGHGTAVVLACSGCDQPLELAIGPATRLYIDGEEMPLQQVPVLQRRPATLFFDPRSRGVTRIHLESSDLTP